MKIIINENTIMFAHTMSRQMELDANKKEISKTISFWVGENKWVIVCKSIEAKHLLWNAFLINSNNSVDLTEYKGLIEGLQL